MERNAWQAVVESLEAEGVPFVFGIPGDPTFLYDALYDSRSARAVLVRHETSGVFMSMAYARVTGKPGVCFGSPGPGVANLVPGLLEAHSACTPVIALACTASTKKEGMGAFQMFMKELATAVQYKAPVTWVVLNNYSLGWPKLHQKLVGGRYIATDFECQPDFAAVARANQCFGERVAEPAQVRGALERALQANEAGTPAVLDFVVEPWEFGPGFARVYQ
jgi:thiamine pyrophosphate-dependent acetolactate synthase large subunit-like protein